ncbi:MAG: hypothetical protein DMF87_15610 [Acidobacteria bacterium]|nr:MAG: hypothetical protein DMF87_15610 [Acidobacteriota bacterium]
MFRKTPRNLVKLKAVMEILERALEETARTENKARGARTRKLARAARHDPPLAGAGAVAAD